MKLIMQPSGGVDRIRTESFQVPFTRGQGFYLEQGDQPLLLEQSWQDDILCAAGHGLRLQAACVCAEDHAQLRLQLANDSDLDFTGSIGYDLGVDSWMETYPQWHKPFFPTMLRCEKTHLWGYFMNTAQNALAIATSDPVACYTLEYNRLADGDFGHRIRNTRIFLLHPGPLPQRHPQDLTVLPAHSSRELTVYLIPVAQPEQIVPELHRIARIPVIQADKYTWEREETLRWQITGQVDRVRLQLPDGTWSESNSPVLKQYGRYSLHLTDPDGKQCQAEFYCRPDWDYYLQFAGREALEKPQKATTHVESFYGLFSAFLAAKHSKDHLLLCQALDSARDVLPAMFDFQTHTPIVIPERIQNTALLISLLVDMYEAAGDIRWLEHASAFADWLMNTKQDEGGVYRSHGRIHYTCVIYIAKAMLELAQAEQNIASLQKAGQRHYLSCKRAVDELVASLDDIDTEGESTLEDGMISCSALQIGMFALTLSKQERKPYIQAAEKMMQLHACLEQQLIPDCRCSCASLRYWESQYDVMAMGNMLNSPHGWSAWTAYAYYYLYLLTYHEVYLIRLMNCLGSCAQLMDLNGQLRWGYCAQPYVKASSLVPDHSRPIPGGFRGRYEEKIYGESYIPMISGWYRLADQKPVGGYAWCPLFLADQTLQVDNQGGCCDNDVHEIFKCIEETVLYKAFAHRRRDGTVLTYGCRAEIRDGEVILHPQRKNSQIITNF